MTPDRLDHVALLVVKLGYQVPGMLLHPDSAPICLRCGYPAEDHDRYEFRDEAGALLRGGSWASGV